MGSANHVDFDMDDEFHFKYFNFEKLKHQKASWKSTWTQVEVQVEIWHATFVVNLLCGSGN